MIPDLFGLVHKRSRNEIMTTLYNDISGHLDPEFFFIQYKCYQSPAYSIVLKRCLS